MRVEPRQLVREGITWSVREADSALIPGSRGARCLIFDSEMIVPRVWRYPEAWAALDDNVLCQCLASTDCQPVSRTPKTVELPREGAPLAFAAETTARTRSLHAEIVLLREANESLRRETHELIAACQQRRAEMRKTVESYAAAMRLDGLPPEQALRLIKGAVAQGLKPVVASEDPDATTVVNDAVAWGIAAYYAA
jgi:hypothetical protein